MRPLLSYWQSTIPVRIRIVTPIGRATSMPWPGISLADQALTRVTIGIHPEPSLGTPGRMVGVTDNYLPHHWTNPRLNGSILGLTSKNLLIKAF